MNIVRYGESGLLLNFEQVISIKTHSKVLAVQHFLQKNPPEGVDYFIPSYCSIVVRFDQSKTTFEQLKQELDAADLSFSETKTSLRQWHIPVCYDDVFGPDLNSTSLFLNISKDELIEFHTGQVYHVFACGFLPGFPYMGITDERLRVKRHDTPRQKVPAGSVGLAGNQTGIYPSESPGGWQIIGRTPLKLIRDDLKMPFLFRPGDVVHFQRISTKDFEEIYQKEETGNLNINNYLNGAN